MASWSFVDSSFGKDGYFKNSPKWLLIFCRNKLKWHPVIFLSKSNWHPFSTECGSKTEKEGETKWRIWAQKEGETKTLEVTLFQNFKPKN